MRLAHVAKLLIFRFELHQAYFIPLPPCPPPPTPAVYGRTLHIHGPLVFENLSPGLFHPLRTQPSDRLTNKPDAKPPRTGNRGGGRGGGIVVWVVWGWGGGGHLLSLPQHPLIHTDNARTRASNQDGAAPQSHHSETVWNNPPPQPTPGFASTHRSLSFAWVKSSQTPGLVLDLPPTSAGERESERTSERGGEGEEEPSRSGSGRREGGRASRRAGEPSSDKSGYGFTT